MTDKKKNPADLGQCNHYLYLDPFDVVLVSDLEEDEATE